MVRPAATVILILVVQRCRNPTNDGINAASPPFSPPRRSRALSALSIAHGAILDRHAASTASGTARRVPLPPPAHAPLFERRDNCASAAVKTAAMPRSPLRRLVDLRFLGRRRQSGDGNGSTLTLTLIPGASGATTTTPGLPGNLRRLCIRSLSFCQQGLKGGAGIGHGPVAEPVVCCGCLFLVVCVAACVVVRAGMTNDPVTSYVCSLYQMLTSFTT